MDRETVFRIAQGSLKALNDDRVMIPSSGNDSIADLKKILRSLMTGNIVLVDAPPAAKPADDKNGK